MKNKAIKILIVSFVLLSLTLIISKVSFAYTDSYSDGYNRAVDSYIDGYNRAMNGYNDDLRQVPQGEREIVYDNNSSNNRDNYYEDRDRDNYYRYENDDSYNSKTVSTPTQTNNVSNASGARPPQVINNYYSLFSSFGSKTSTDNSTSSNSSNKVATTDKTTTKSQDNTKTTLSSDSKNINDSRYDSRYGGAIDTTGSRLGASAYGSNFTPNTFWGWFISIILILAIIIVVRIIMRPKEKEVKKANS